MASASDDPAPSTLWDSETTPKAHDDNTRGCRLIRGVFTRMETPSPTGDGARIPIQLFDVATQQPMARLTHNCGCQ